MINYFPSGSICSHSSTMKASQKGWSSQFGISFISYGLWLKYKVSWAIESHCQILKDNQEQGLWCPPEYLLLIRIPIGETLNSSWKRRLFFISTQVSKNFKFLYFLIDGTCRLMLQMIRNVTESVLAFCYFVFSSLKRKKHNSSKLWKSQVLEQNIMT